MRVRAALIACVLSCAACSTLTPEAGRKDLPKGPTGSGAPKATAIPIGPVAPSVPENSDSTSTSGDTASLPGQDQDQLPGNLWEQIRAAMVFPDLADRTEVRAEIEVLRRDRHFLANLRARGPVLRLIVSEAQVCGIPGEAMLLPYIESKINPSASHAGNVGMWQFRAGTAMRNGLRVDADHDERLDAHKSTQAACAYLNKMAAMFGGDWVLALTAFNIGDGSMRNAMAAMPGTKDIFRLPISRGARRHMARLTALSAIVRNPGRYGITLPAIAPGLPLAATPRTSTLSLVAKPASDATKTPDGVDAAKTSLVANTATALIFVDTPKVQRSIHMESAHHHRDRQALPHTTHDAKYTVRADDTLHSIAKQNDISVAQLRRINGLRDNLIHRGDMLIIPRK